MPVVGNTEDRKSLPLGNFQFSGMQLNNKKQQHNVVSAGEGTVPPAQEHQALMNPIRIQSGWRTRGTGKGPTQKARQAPEGLTVLLGEQPKCRDGNDLGWGWLSNQSSEQPGSSDQKTESSPRKA